MSDLLKKKKQPNLLSKSEVLKPSEPYKEHSLINRSSRNSSSTSMSASNVIEETKPIKNKKSTTIRCNIDTAQHLSAIITCQDYGSVNELLIHLVDLYEGNLTSNERKEIAQVKSVLTRKNK